MIKKFTLIAALIVFNVALVAQVAPGFNFQGVARDADGEPLKDKSIDVVVGIRSGSGSGTLVWEEEHTTTTNEFGLFTLEVCGNNSLKTDGTAATVDDIDWASDNHYIDLQVDAGQGMVDLGATQLLSVPYSMVTNSYPNTVAEMSVQPQSTVEAGEAIFIVKREDGYPVFAVYEDGVWVYTDDDAEGKGIKGGFAVGGYNTANKAPASEYFMVSPDSARIYVNSYEGKGIKGGFAVGGYNTANKGNVDEFLRVTRDSTRVYVNTDVEKGIKGGFAVGGYNTANKSGEGSFMSLDQDNYFIGHNSGNKVTWGVHNSVLGYESGLNISTGNSNAFLGYQAGYKNTFGSGNLFLGYQSGFSNEEGGNNTFVGNSAGYSNTIGIHNSFMGSFSGYSNQTGGFNTFVGDSAGYSNSGGYSNTIIGTSAGLSNTTGYSNLMIGNKAGYSNTEGGFNVFLGHESGASNTTGGDNVFVGTLAGYATKGGYSNIFVGSRAGADNTSGYSNLMIGTEAGYSNFDGSFNVFLGHESGKSNSIGGANVFVGWAAGLKNETGGNNIYLGTSAGEKNVIGEANVFIGFASGKNTIGNHNVFIGNRAGQDQNGDGKLFINNHESDSTNALIWGDFYAHRLRFNANVGIGKDPDWYPLSIYRPDGIAVVSIAGTGDDHNYTSIELKADSGGVNNFYALNHTKNDEFCIVQAIGDSYPIRFMLDKFGHGAINKNTDHRTFSVFDDDASAHLGLSGVGNAWDYSLITLEGSELPGNPHYAIAHKIDHSLEISYVNDTDYFPRIKITETGMVGINNWDPQEALDVVGNARFSGVISGAGDDLVISAEGVLGRSASDARLKSDIQPLLNSLEKVMLMDGYTFTWKEDDEKNRDAGLIAQDVAEIFPEAVFENPIDGYMGINYSRFPALFVEAFKQQQTIIEDQEDEIDELKSRLDKLEELVLRND